jgi:hypothetical protein
MRFPCPAEPESTIEVESCLGRQLLALNAAVNAHVSRAWSLVGDKIGRHYFANGEHAWRAYVENTCTSRSGSWVNPRYALHQYVGGTGAPIRSQVCRLKLTRIHLRELNEFILERCSYYEEIGPCRRLR